MLPAINAAQHERTGCAGCVGQRGRLYLSTTEQKGAMWRSKSGPLWLGDELVPVVHGRAPRAARRAFPMGRRGAARGRDLWAHGVKRMALKRPGFSLWFCSA